VLADVLADLLAVVLAARPRLASSQQVAGTLRGPLLCARMRTEIEHPFDFGASLCAEQRAARRGLACGFPGAEGRATADWAATAVGDGGF